MRVIAGTHNRGRLSAKEIKEIAVLAKENALTCCIPQGGALLMRPMLLHASSRCDTPMPRRVIHLEFAAAELPEGLEWGERVCSETIPAGFIEENHSKKPDVET